MGGGSQDWKPTSYPGQISASEYNRLKRAVFDAYGVGGVNVDFPGGKMRIRVQQSTEAHSPWTLIPRQNPEDAGEILVRVFPAYFKGPVADAFDYEPTISATSIWDEEYPEVTLASAGTFRFFAAAATDENGDLEGVTIAAYKVGVDTMPTDVMPDPWTPSDGEYYVEIGQVAVTAPFGLASGSVYRQFLTSHVQFRAAPNGYGLILPTV